MDGGVGDSTSTAVGTFCAREGLRWCRAGNLAEKMLPQAVGHHDGSWSDWTPSAGLRFTIQGRLTAAPRHPDALAHDSETQCTPDARSGITVPAGMWSARERM